MNHNPPGRIVSRFSCGAASAVATKLVLNAYELSHEIEIINAFLVEEHPDNRRFLADCERWFGRKVTVLRDERFGASTREVFRRERYMNGLNGAPCTRALKRTVLDAFNRPGDTHVLGFTVDEEDRFDRWIDANNDRRAIAPLIDAKLTKSDVLALVDRAGIDVPLMYRLGFHNANCIGCVKGGMGYWNKVREHFPDDFEEMAAIQETIGPGAYLFRDRKTQVRFSLRELKPGQGRYADEPSIECGAACELVESSRTWNELA
jgi:3'-phosphoadenosine 5'-phosphosulfate sulfotransferase (PAPS reductase)/FAD synthetase